MDSQEENITLVPTGDFGDDVIHISKDMKRMKVDPTLLKQIGEQTEAQMGMIEEDMVMEEGKERIEKELKDKFAKEVTIWMTERVTAATDPYVQLHNEIVEFYNKYGPSEEDNQI